MFCPPTPDGGLTRVLREIIKKQKMDGGLDIKIVESSGIKIAKLLPGLKEEKDYGRKDCFIHTTGGKGSCNRESVVYKGTCLTCKDNGENSVYKGETSRSAHVRGKQHMEAIRDYSKHVNNAFGKHIRDEHAGNETKFRLDIIKYLHSPLERQVREGVEIVKAKAYLVLNSKLDHYQPGMKRITFTRMC